MSEQLHKAESVCEVCEKPTAEPIIHPEEGDAYCGRCVVELIGAERDALRRALQDAISSVVGPVRYMGQPTYSPQISVAQVQRWRAVLNGE